MRIIHGTTTQRRPSPLEEVYAHFRLDRQGMPVAPRTLGFFDEKVGAFLAWLRREHSEVVRLEDLEVTTVRQYRVEMAAGGGLRGKDGRAASCNCGCGSRPPRWIVTGGSTGQRAGCNPVRVTVTSRRTAASDGRALAAARAWRQ